MGPSQPEQELRLHVIPTGDYTLIATTYCEHPFQNSGVVIPTTFKLPGATECTGTFNVSATSNPAPESSGFIALLLWLLAGPAIWLLRKSTTESRRWQNSNI